MWTIPGSDSARTSPYEDTELYPGDTVTLVWEGFPHDARGFVLRAPVSATAACLASEEGTEELAPVAAGAGDTGS